MINRIKFRRDDGTEISYQDMLDLCREHIGQHYSEQISQASDDGRTQKQFISTYLKTERIFPILPDGYDQEIEGSPVEVLYQDMAGISWLSKYLEHPERYPTLEEININAWNSSRARFTDRGDVPLNESFLSPQHAIDTIRKIMMAHNGILDEGTPGQISYISDQIRITGLIPPLISKSVGVSASIRIVSDSISGQEYDKTGVVSPDMREFLDACVQYGISILIGGAPHAGKTTLLNNLLSKIPDDQRILTIEEGSRELHITKYDEQGRMKNQVVGILTRPSDKKDQNYDTSKCLELSLRFDAEYIVPQEMRSSEANVAVEATNTGACVLSTIHTSGAENAYSRVSSLMQKTTKQTKDVLMSDAVEAFPIVAFMRKMRDKQRRVVEILEGEDYSRETGLKSRSLFQYVVEDNIRNPDGSVTVKGEFHMVKGISDKLKRRFINNGAPKRLAEKFAKGGSSE